MFKAKASHLTIIKGKKNILCINGTLLVGGAERLNLSIAQGIKGGNFSFHLITTVPAKNMWTSKFKPYFQNILTPMDDTAEMRYRRIDHKRLHFLIRKLNINLIMLNQSGYEFIPKLKSKYPSIPIIDIVHTELNPSIDTIRFSAPNIDMRICISNKVRNYLAEMYKRYGIPETYINRLNVIHNGVDITEFTSNPQTKGRFKERFSISNDFSIISFVGRFSDPKNPILFVDIARKIILRSHGKIKFVMAGDGPDLKTVKHRIEQYGLEPHFILTGMTDNVAELLNDTNILLVVSKREGLPLVILEAMSMGVPVISTNVGAIDEVVQNGLNGFLIESGNGTNAIIASFASTILELLADQNKNRSLASKARETVNSGFSLETMCSKYQHVLDELIE